MSRFEVYPTAQIFCGKPDPLYSTQYSDLYVAYTDGFNIHTGQPNPHSMIDKYISGKLVLDTSNTKFIFPALNVSNNFATIDYDAHINTESDYIINHVFRSMTVQELNTLYTICELDRNQLLKILAMSVQNPHFAGFLLTGNRSNFLYVEGSTAWLYDCPHFLSPLYKADRCFDRLPIHIKGTLMYVGPITRQTYYYDTPITCDNNPRNIIELDPDSDEQNFYILGPEPIKRKPPSCLHLLKLKLQYALTLSQPKMLVYIQMQNLINSGTELCFLNILIQHFNYLVKLLVSLSFHLILLTLKQIPLMIIHIIPYVLDSMINYSI